MYAIVVHGGAGGTSSNTKRGCQQATEVGIKVLREGGGSLEAAVAVVEWMENSGRYNAGSGSILRLDGQTIEMDAVVASSEGPFGAVEVVRGIKNPVRLALAVTKTPHHILTGEGAASLAQQLGLEPHPGPTTRVRKRYESMRKAIGEGRLVPPGWTSEELERLWSIEGFFGVDPVLLKGGTVGAIALDGKGVVALASSTGGSGLMRPGRIGDVPIRGSGWQIGEHGGVLATGIGEVIMEREGSGRVFTFMAQGLDPQRACEQIAGEFPLDIPVGFIALNKQGSIGIGKNCEMDTYSFKE